MLSSDIIKNINLFERLILRLKTIDHMILGDNNFYFIKLYKNIQSLKVIHKNGIQTNNKLENLEWIPLIT